MRAHVGLTAALTLGASLDASAYQRTQTPGDDPVSIGWTRRCIAYHLNERGSDDMAFSTFQTVANRAFAAWQSVDCSDVEVHAVGLTNAETVGYTPGQTNINQVIGREGGDWIQSADVLALTTVTFCNEASGTLCPSRGRIIDADIEVNGDDFTFSTTNDPRRMGYDLGNTLTHEAGHFLGLDHTQEGNGEATMYATAPAGERKKASLDGDDQLGLCAAYPARTPVPECEPFEVASDFYLQAEAEPKPEDEGCACDVRPAVPRLGAGPVVLVALLALASLRRRRVR